MDATARTQFVDALLQRGVLAFGDFVLKSGRRSPYFFNMGSVNDGDGIALLADAYLDAMDREGFQPDLIFGPAYKGIPLAVALSMAAQRRGRNLPWAFNRKEAKDHGEGGSFVGAPIEGRVLIVDDIITAGTAAREVVPMLQASGAEVVGLLTALDRCERFGPELTAAQTLESELGVPVRSVISLHDVIDYLDLAAAADKDRASDLDRVAAYQKEHCA